MESQIHEDLEKSGWYDASKVITEYATGQLSEEETARELGKYYDCTGLLENEEKLEREKVAELLTVFWAVSAKFDQPGRFYRLVRAYERMKSGAQCPDETKLHVYKELLSLIPAD